MPVPASHDVLGTPLQPPFPEGSRRSWWAWAASGAPSACSGACPACTRRRSATPAATRRTRPTRRSAAGRPATPRPCWSSSTPAKISRDEILRTFWEGHDPTQGMRQGNDVGTQYRSAVYYDSDEQRAAVEASRDRYQASLTAAGPRRDHDRDRPGGPVLLRRGLPPAVPRQEPERLLRPRAARASPARSAWAPPPSRAMRLDHVALTVADRDRSATFYARHLGFGTVVHDDDRLLILADASGGLLALSPGEVPALPRTNHFGIRARSGRCRPRRARALRGCRRARGGVAGRRHVRARPDPRPGRLPGRRLRDLTQISRHPPGGVAERLNATVLKTVEPGPPVVPRVRIPPPPLYSVRSAR